MSNPKNGASAPKQSVQPKLNFRDQMTINSHCFKLLPTQMKKNTSWQKGIVILDHMEHGHYYHSHNSWGMPQEICSHVGGHFHKIEWFVDAQGNMKAKCGPAQKKDQKRLPNGLSKTSNIDIKFMDKINDKVIVDDHTHEIEYQHSSNLSLANGSASAVKAAAMEQPAKFDNGEVSMSVQD